MVKYGKYRENNRTTGTITLRINEKRSKIHKNKTFCSKLLIYHKPGRLLNNETLKFVFQIKQRTPHALLILQTLLPLPLWSQQLKISLSSSKMILIMIACIEFPAY